MIYLSLLFIIISSSQNYILYMVIDVTASYLILKASRDGLQH